MRRVGIVGGGAMGNWHALRWQALPVELTGFYDADRERAVGLAAKYGGQAFTSEEQLLSHSDVVDICTPPAAHAATTIAAARAEKHVVCEKPIARQLAQASCGPAGADVPNEDNSAAFPPTAHADGRELRRHLNGSIPKRGRKCVTLEVWRLSSTNASDPAHVCNRHARSSPETSVAVVFHDRWSWRLATQSDRSIFFTLVH